MEKNDIKKIMASIGAIMVLLSVSGCSTDLDIDELYSDKTIAQIEEEQDLVSISKIYKDVLFTSFPIQKSTDYDKEYLKSLFDIYYLDIDFDGAYTYLNNYVEHLKSKNKGDISEKVFNNLEVTKEDEYSYNAIFDYTQDDKEYVLNLMRSEYILDFYDSVTEKCINDNISYSKSYKYSINKLPGDKNEWKNKARWSITYSIEFSGEDNVLVSIMDENVINKKYGEINTLESTKRILVFKNGVLVYEHDLTSNQYNALANDIYNAFVSDLTVENIRDSKDYDSLRRVLKKQDN